MLCPKCNKSIKDNSIECPFCGIVIEKYKSADTFNPGEMMSEPEEQKAHRNIPYLKIGLIIVGIILLWMTLRPQHEPELTAGSFEGSEISAISCEAKEKCVIVYVAPWCPYCKMALGVIKELRAKWADSESIDFIIVIGLDKIKNLNRMADEIGGEVYLDPDGDVIKRFGGRGIPHWYVLDSDNKLLRHFGGYVPEVELLIQRLGL